MHIRRLPWCDLRAVIVDIYDHVQGQEVYVYTQHIVYNIFTSQLSWIGFREFWASFFQMVREFWTILKFFCIYQILAKNNLSDKNVTENK